MPFSFNGLQYIVGTPETVEGMQALKALRPFDDAVIAFLNDLSGELRKIREYPDVATFGFWCRKAALMQESWNTGSGRPVNGVQTFRRQQPPAIIRSITESQEKQKRAGL